MAIVRRIDGTARGTTRSSSPASTGYAAGPAEPETKPRPCVDSALMPTTLLSADRPVPAPIMAVANTVAGFGLYLLFAGQVSTSELATGAGVAVAAAGWTLAARAGHGRWLAVGADHLAPWGRALAELPWATLRTAGALVAALFGRAPQSEAAPFVHGPADAAADNGRRATAVLAASLAPDSFVVRTPQGEDRALIHRIVPATKAVEFEVADVTGWDVAALALLPPLGVAVVVAGRGAVPNRLVAVQLATSLTVLLLIIVSFADDQPATIDLALTLALLALPGTLVMALFLERWL